METFYRPKLTLLLLAIGANGFGWVLWKTERPLNGHRYSLMHDPIDSQEIEYLVPHCGAEIQYKFLLKCNSYEIMLKKIDFNAITQIYRINSIILWQPIIVLWQSNLIFP
jgi:hypothetical protein